MIDGPYKLPKGWRWVRLGEVCIYERQTIDPRRYPHQEFLLFSIPAYDNNKQPELRKGSEIRSSKLKIKPNICLFSKLNPRIPRAWVIKSDESISDLPMLASTEFLALRPHTHLIDLDYLGLCLLSNVFLSQFQVGLTGATSSRQRLKQEDVLNALLPLPPLEEQKRIVARIEELMDKIKEAKKLRQETKKQTELLWQSILAETFPQPGTQLPNGWRWVRLGDVARIFSGSRAPQDKRYFEKGSIPFVRVQDLGRYSITTNLTETSDKINEKAVKELRLVKANKGTILFPKSGAAILTNSRAILGEDAYIVSHLAAVEPLHNVLETLWAFYWLCTVDMGRYIDNPAYPSLRLSKIRELLLPLPPLEEQKRIANYLQEVHEKIKELKEVQTRTEEEIKFLEQSILEKAFRGEL
jgi:type I restriction enzyme S subunit